MKTGKWQHRVPLRDPHPIKVRYTSSRAKPTCSTCKKVIRWVAVDDGPESLKSLLF